MNRRLALFVALVTLAAGLMPATAAWAQYSGAGFGRQPAPLYPYAVRGNRPSTVEAAPRNYPYVGNAHASKIERPYKRKALTRTKGLRRHHSVKRAVVRSRGIVRKPPAVIESKPQVTVEERGPRKPAATGTGKERVITADAEVTIFGPDRMVIRIFRKQDQSKRNATPAEQPD